MKITRPAEKPLFFMLAEKTAFFLFGMCVLPLFLYAVGNSRRFPDTVLRFLLNTAGNAGAALCFISLAGFFFSFFSLLFLNKRFKYLACFFFFFILGGFGAASALFSFSVLAWTK